ncbi:hypothetical protein RHMOL_Rhmol01G0238100 [Rhododendron molle]|uniref:Uncharacterized protein n=1 Tax=Rhododendron molle TaxID=49168 RepID=A0ACC0Q630_RHOML|nr:hypothetical protein RHMOL_Rhmol01G0238100 [Rhododendron molle]
MGGCDFMGKTPEDAWDYFESLAEKTQTCQFADPWERAMFNQGNNSENSLLLSIVLLKLAWRRSLGSLISWN